MKTVYYKAGDAEWKYELEDEEHDNIINNLLQENADLEEMVNDSFEILRDLSSLDDDELDEDDIIDQTISIAVLWHYFNTVPPEGERLEGDIVVIENEDGDGVSIVAASDVIEEDEE
ncbi:hypothetical protein [Telmatospirillum sp. J64-1]|uniref:hypothetical protein n=1 Tax=Telmatospirillum sp. J64-1 TaxID=2502183 RepID=UPI00115E0479|nr:hypothetical protein [Telmatospirillum sp. J64-1]